MSMRRHAFDPWSFVPGIVLAAFALVVLIGGVDVTGWNFSWAGPAVLIVLGLALLVGSRGKREPRAAVVESAERSPERESDDPDAEEDD
jgi:peptidoglycan/LPS O-acetylase OafA/YrhL